MTVEQGVKRADLHIHTRWSDGIAHPEEIVDLAILQGLSAIAITDHDVYQSSRIAYAYAQKHHFPLDVLLASEVSSADGHILAYNIDAPIASGQTIENSITEIHKRGGLVVAAHPGIAHISSLSFRKIQSVIDSPDPELYFDGIEVFNGSGLKLQRFDAFGIVFRRNFTQLMSFLSLNQGNVKLGGYLGGSDSHTKMIGTAYTEYSGSSVSAAIQNGEIRAMVANQIHLKDLSEVIMMCHSILRAHLLRLLNQKTQINDANSHI